MKDNAQVIRTGMKVEETYVEDTNFDTKNNGVYFEIDEPATKLFCEEQKAKKEAKNLEKTIASSLTVDVIKELISSKKKDAAPVEKVNLTKK